MSKSNDMTQLIKKPFSLELGEGDFDLIYDNKFKLYCKDVVIKEWNKKATYRELKHSVIECIKEITKINYVHISEIKSLEILDMIDLHRNNTNLK